MVNASGASPEGALPRCPQCGIPLELAQGGNQSLCPRCNNVRAAQSAAPPPGLEFLLTEAVVADLGSATKESVIEALVESLCLTGALPEEDRSSICAAVLRREQICSTGIGQGVAVPHARHPSVRRVVGTIGFSRSGINYNSLDGEPAYTFILLVSPDDRPALHLRALEQVSRQLRSPEFLAWLKQLRDR